MTDLNTLIINPGPPCWEIATRNFRCHSPPDGQDGHRYLTALPKGESPGYFLRLMASSSAPAPKSSAIVVGSGTTVKAIASR